MRASKQALTIVVLLLLVVQLQGSCWDGEGYWKCRGRTSYPGYYGWCCTAGWYDQSWYWNTATCYENENGAMNVCYNWDTARYTWNYAGSSPWYYGWASHNFYNWYGWVQGDNSPTHVYLKCHIYCSNCNAAGSPWSSCLSCNTNYYRWVKYQRCLNYCPNELNEDSHSNYYTDNTIGEYKSSSWQCADCANECAICDGGSLTSCYTCRFSGTATVYYLLDDPSGCTSRFTWFSYFNSTSTTCYSRQCWTTANACPSLYYPVAQSSMSGFTSWTRAIGQDYADNGVYYYRRENSAVCMFCDNNCEICWGPEQYQCTKCLYFNYMWAQYPNYCFPSCPMGNWVGGWYGEYIDESANSITTGAGTRVCLACQSRCVWCKLQTDECYYCKDNSYLLDLNTTCQATFTAASRATWIYGATVPACTRCQNPTYDMCNAAAYAKSRQCIASCPTYLYFPTGRCTSTTNMLCTNHPRYNTENAASSQTYFNATHQTNTSVEYRRYTRMCKLCDYRCVQCDGPLNVNCFLCANFYYKWQPVGGVTMNICEDFCPDGQYIALDNTTSWANETECNYCESHCELCEGKVNNCSLCITYPSTNFAFLYTYNDSFSTCQTTCTTSATPATTLGYYGSIATMTCYPCPSPCSNCNIALITAQYPDLKCDGDDECTNGIICTDCLTGYVKVAGQCITTANCREYAFYNESSLSAQWSATNCVCLPGHSKSGALIATCDIRCHIRCKTCSGTSASSCLSCEQGYTLSGSTCNSAAITSWAWARGDATTISQGDGLGNTYYLNESMGDSSGSYVTRTCGNFSSYWGYENQDGTYATQYVTSSKRFGITFGIFSDKYYAISVKVQLIFIDEYATGGAMYISRDAYTNAPVATWDFDVQEAYGESLCGDNRMDYIMMAEFTVPSINRTTEHLYLSSNQDLLISELGYKVYWGFDKILVTALKCHADCTYCSGPTASECLSCATAGYVAVNGTCKCDTSNGYYAWSTDSGNCHLGCPLNDGWFTDGPTRACVKPPTTSNCSAPLRFGNALSPATYGACTDVCPGSLYISQLIMKCTSDCGALGQYKYDGAVKSCETVCPGGLFRDPSTFKCVQKCPSNWYLEIANRNTDPFCTDTCNDWEYPGLQICVTSCPNSYYKQVQSGHNKCVIQCVNAFADLETGTCVTECPFPTYADTHSRLCVHQCTSATEFMQVAVANLNRTCVGTCETGQYGNPFTMKCSNYTTECPDGYFADSLQHMCVTNCSATLIAENSTKNCATACTTGFAYWTIRVCVATCPTNPPMFGNLNTKLCVSNCNHAVTGLYGDYQANRTCVLNCSASPVALFGHNSTSLCVDYCPVAGQYADPGDPYRRCVTVCSSSPRRYYFTPTRQCVLTCPDHYYTFIDPTLGGLCASQCTAPNFADPVDNMCRPVCKYGWWGLPDGIRPCVQTCPYDWFAINLTTTRLCVTLCDSGYYADLETSMCYANKTSCSNSTYGDFTKRQCVIAPNCTEGTYADPATKGCESTCSNGLLKDENINTCVEKCSSTPDEYNMAGLCTPFCTGGRYADWQYNRTCRASCSRSPLVTYGIFSTKRCVVPSSCPASHYGDNTTQLCVNPCTGAFPFGDSVTRQCVLDCPDGTWGDSASHLCEPVCDFTTFHYADNQTGNCETLCTLGTFGVNSSTADPVPSCEYECPEGSYARDSDRICVADCGPGLYGDPITRVCHSDPMDCFDGYYANSVSHLCELPDDCQTVTTHYFANNGTKTCIDKCIDPNYGDTDLYMCVPVCPEGYFGENTTRLCLGNCNSVTALAEDQNNLCVARCSNAPVRHFADWVNKQCVLALDCPIDANGDQTYARNASQTCEAACITGEWADPTTMRCVATCPTGYYGDDSTGKRVCMTSCAGLYRYRDNSTKTCVDICPSENSTFGDEIGDICVRTCPVNYFAQVDTNRRCVLECKATTWGNAISRICITDPLVNCPTGTWADDFTHLCMGTCSASQGYYGYNATKKCVTSCPSPNFAFDGSRVCIDVCPASLTGSGYFGDPDTTPTRKCFLSCQTPSLYRDPVPRICKTTCTYNSTYKTYKDPTTMSC